MPGITDPGSSLKLNPTIVKQTEWVEPTHERLSRVRDVADIQRLESALPELTDEDMKLFIDTFKDARNPEIMRKVWE